MKDNSRTERAFIWSSRAWYADAVRDGEEIMFGMYAKEGGTTGEMGMRWKDLGGKKRVPQLQVFDDAWETLAMFPDLIKALGEHDNKNITPQEFVDILVVCGFADFTEYERGVARG